MACVTRALQSVYRSVVVARLLYVCNAWWGFTTSDDRQRLGVRRGFCSPDLINIDNLVSDMDDKLFFSILKTSITFHKNYFIQNALTAVIHSGRDDVNFLSRIRLGWTNRILFTDLSIKTHIELTLIFICSLNFVIVLM